MSRPPFQTALFAALIVGIGTMPAALRAADGSAVPAARVASAWHYQVVEGSGGVPLNVVTAGDKSKPAILLVHGIGQSHLSWENQLGAPLTDEFYVVAFDLRGHGNSGKPWNADAYQDYRNWAGDVQRVIAATGIDRPVLVGWSYGTLVVSDYLRTYGASGLRGIVLTGAYGGLTPPPPPAPPDRAAMMTRLREKQFSGNLEDNIAAARDFSRFLTGKEMPAAWYERATALSMTLPGYARRWMFDRPVANMELIPKITVPFLVTVGGKDPSTPEKDARDLAAKVPGTRVSVYPDCGHSPFAEDPARYTKELADFARAALLPAQAVKLPGKPR